MTPAQRQAGVDAKRRDANRKRWQRGQRAREKLSAEDLAREAERLAAEIAARIEAGDVILGPPAGWRFIQDAAAA
ncbi:hypothetical protein GVY41_18980 [Frigidibacter albus]|uniref:Uncharacterized protein n=1 Tax=Frigidibacter albus TaxID=1465486 RepID=A0A6L8VPU1_9RHOB|nr:hypothetical protein [Frigidibacter albus]MZQ91160.1 hypothetical protein [Frigidibacter albus]NBE33086.1 hypothetical protein [Frigidibacter albus]GGH63161.1 hypothetical protein GCM10011341_38040 [Frigidibacter albus]